MLAHDVYWDLRLTIAPVALQACAGSHVNLQGKEAPSDVCARSTDRLLGLCQFTGPGRLAINHCPHGATAHLFGVHQHGILEVEAELFREKMHHPVRIKNVFLRYICLVSEC